MKIHALWLIPAIGVSFYFGRISYSFNQIGNMSTAGQTLQDLGRSLLQYQVEHGQYPESISNLSVKPSSGEFSKELLKRVIYYRTAKGYVAFLGLPQVSYVDERLVVKSK